MSEEKYDGWALKMPNKKIHPRHYQPTQNALIAAVETSFSMLWNSTLEPNGYKAVKVKLVEVE